MAGIREFRMQDLGFRCKSPTLSTWSGALRRRNNVSSFEASRRRRFATRSVHFFADCEQLIVRAGLDRCR